MGSELSDRQDLFCIWKGKDARYSLWAEQSADGCLQASEGIRVAGSADSAIRKKMEIEETADQAINNELLENFEILLTKKGTKKS